MRSGRAAARVPFGRPNGGARLTIVLVLVIGLVCYGDAYAQQPSGDVSAIERQTLTEFFAATGGERWKNHDGWGTTTPICNWYGVFCDFVDGDASRPFQRFELKQTPLTYRASENEVGATAELVVRIGDIRWRERATMYGAKPGDRAYTLSTDEQGRQFILFGDGARGARLPTGVNNVRAAYRKGLGVDGNVKAGALTQLMSRPLGLKSFRNPLAA